MKICTKCKQEKALTEFHKDKQKRDGLTSSCKSCQKEGRAKYYVDNREAIAARQAEYYADNKEAKAAYRAEYYLNNREAEVAYKAEYYSDPANNLRHRAVLSHNQSLRKVAAQNDGVKPFVCPEEAELIIEFLMAARTLSEQTGIAFEVDHIVPISKGGQHCLSNLQCITRADNRAKGNKLNFTAYTQKPSFPSKQFIAADKAA